MNITITGSLGNISKPLAQQLIYAGHKVTIVSSNEARATEITALGAIAAIGSVADTGFLAKAFTGADVVYTMVPPDFSVSNLRAYMGDTGQNYANAIMQAGVKRVVNLSSMGAHLGSGTGPIVGHYDVEHIMNELQGVAVKHIRAPFFYVNFYGNIDMIKNKGILGANYGGDVKLIMVHPADIAVVVAEELQNDLTGKSIRYIASDECTPQEAAAILGAAIGKPELPWVEFSDEQAQAGMLQAGMPEEISNRFVELGTAVRSGIIWMEYLKEKATTAPGKIKLKTFAQEFAAKYNS